MISLQQIAKALSGDVRGKEVLAPAPGHTAKDRGMSIRLAPSAPGGLLVHLFNGGDPLAAKDIVCEKCGLPPFRLAPKRMPLIIPKRNNASKRNGPAKDIVRETVYDYRDPFGVLRYHKKRIDYSDGSKDLPFFQPNGEGGRGGPNLLYGGERLADLGLDQPVWIVEGEKKVDRLYELGQIAVSGDAGCNSIWLPEHGELLRGLKVILWPDSDQAGETYIANAAAAIRPENSNLTVVRPFEIDGNHGRDVCDWHGNIEELAASAKPYGPVQVARSEDSFVKTFKDGGAFLLEYVPISYTLDGVLPSGVLYFLTARRSTGKTAWLLAALFAIALGRGKEILGIDVERDHVAFICLENPTDIRMKMAVYCYVYSISKEDLDRYVTIIDARQPIQKMMEQLHVAADKKGAFQLVGFDSYQAGFGSSEASKCSGGDGFNNNFSVLCYTQELRLFLSLPGNPSVIVLAHPSKSGIELLPYGGGSIANEYDGNLTLETETGAIKLHWYDKLRGPDFKPLYYKIEMLSSPDILDTKGRQILLPVCRPADEQSVEQRQAAKVDAVSAILKAMTNDPKGSEREWAHRTMMPRATLRDKLAAMEKDKLVEKSTATGRYSLTRKGKLEMKQFAPPEKQEENS